VCFNHLELSDEAELLILVTYYKSTVQVLVCFVGKKWSMVLATPHVHACSRFVTLVTPLVNYFSAVVYLGFHKGASPPVSASEMTYIVSSGALNSTHSLSPPLFLPSLPILSPSASLPLRTSPSLHLPTSKAILIVWR